jgi:hypothetical protein
MVMTQVVFIFRLQVENFKGFLTNAMTNKSPKVHIDCERREMLFVQQTFILLKESFQKLLGSFQSQTCLVLNLENQSKSNSTRRHELTSIRRRSHYKAQYLSTNSFKCAQIVACDHPETNFTEEHNDVMLQVLVENPNKNTKRR